MPACEEGAAPARARTWTGMGHLGKSALRCRLAKREQLQRVRDDGEESAISGSVNRDDGLPAGNNPSECETMDRNSTMRRGYGLVRDLAKINLISGSVSSLRV